MGKIGTFLALVGVIVSVTGVVIAYWQFNQPPPPPPPKNFQLILLANTEGTSGCSADLCFRVDTNCVSCPSARISIEVLLQFRVVEWWDGRTAVGPWNNIDTRRTSTTGEVQYPWNVPSGIVTSASKVHLRAWFQGNGQYAEEFSDELERNV